MARLGQETLRVLKLQETLSKKLDVLEAHQGKVHMMLVDMEAEALKLFEQESQGRDAIDNRRLELCDRAIALSESLSQCAAPPPVLTLTDLWEVALVVIRKVLHCFVLGEESLVAGEPAAGRCRQPPPGAL
jgi:hypothetical protein